MAENKVGLNSEFKEVLELKSSIELEQEVKWSSSGLFSLQKQWIEVEEEPKKEFN